MAFGLYKGPVPEKNWAVRAARWYGRLTGAGSGFGFFSPNVPNRQIFIEFDVDSEGQMVHTSLQEAAGSDVAFRLGNMIRDMLKAYEKKDVFRSFAASLTASVFRRYPKAREITLHAKIYQYPTMKEYRDGMKPQETEIYSAKFGMNP